MGYESKFFAVKEYQFPTEGLHHSEIIATLDMCKMGDDPEIAEFLDLFDTETTFSIYMGDCDPETGEEVMMDVSEDKYGDRLCYLTEKKKAIALIKSVMDREDYWRFNLLLEFLRMFAKYDSVYIVHYGY